MITPWKRKFRVVLWMARSDGLWVTAQFAGRKLLYATLMGRIIHAAFFFLIHKPYFLAWRFLNRGRPVQVPCLRPFTELNIGSGGRCHLCCASWLPVPVGNLNRDSIGQAFNSVIAQGIRIGMYTGRYGHCNAVRCMTLSSPSFRPIAEDEILQVETIPEEDKKTILSRELQFPEGPSRLTESIHSFCNIRCEFCFCAKTGGFDTGEQSRMLLARLHDSAIAHASHLRLLAFNGGEPLVDPWVRAILTRLQNSGISFQFTSNLNRIDETMRELLSGIKIHRINGSLNAASRDTYQRLCRGGDWESVLQNLDFILRLRDSASKRFSVGISMVVNKWNYMEVAAFAELGISLKVDRIIYHPMYGHGGNEHLRLGNQERQELKRLLESNVFTSQEVCFDIDALRACST